MWKLLQMEEARIRDLMATLQIEACELMEPLQIGKARIRDLKASL